MPEPSSNKRCVILMGMGGPDSSAGVKEFLYNIFSDPEIINLPGGKLLRGPFAKMISNLRANKVRGHYDLIGGGSPLLKWTEAQRDNIEFILTPVYPGFKCFIAMRYFRPRAEEAIHEAYSEGYRSFYFLPLYPQYCKATTGSSFAEAKRILRRYPEVTARYIDDFHDHPGYTDLLKNYIDNNIGDTDILLFSAHSIPEKFVTEGDPYVDQIKETVRLAAGDRPYHLSFQSRTGPVKWVGPDTVGEVKRLLSENPDKNLFIVPISFVCDHIETLYELDIELKSFVAEADSPRIRRMPMFNDDRRFGSVLADIIINRMDNNDA
ncbi:MAG TPA: ferrochelatase [candidate division Zixibacteria bacterium]|nr:ferrochelatase [candidate division Zixibacteria bacterium]